MCSASTYTVTGTISGLSAGQQVTLLDNGGDSLTLNANGSFSFATPVAQGASYTVTVGTQPTAQLCSLSSGTGVGSQVTAGITAVVCASSSYAIGGTLGGLAAGQQLTLLDNSGDALNLSADGSFTFPTALPQGASYTVTVGTQPTGQDCWVNQGTHYPVSAAVASIVVSCETAMHVYAANNSGNTISQYTVGSDGSLSPMTPATVATGNGPVGVAVDPAGKYLYVTNNVDQTIAQYAINPDGSLGSSPINAVATGNAPWGLAIDPLGRYVYVLNSTGSIGSISQYTVGSGGKLTPMATPTVSSEANSQFLVIDSSGKYLYAGGSGSVDQYIIGGGGQLSPMSPASVAPGAFNWDPAVDPSGHYLYVGQYTAGSVSQASIGSAGALTLLSPSSVSAGADQAFINIDPTGRYLYASAYSNTYQFAIGSGGFLIPLQTPKIASQSLALRGAAVDPSGRYYYQVSLSSGILQFTIASGGQLSPMPTPSVASGANTYGLAVH